MVIRAHPDEGLSAQSLGNPIEWWSTVSILNVSLPQESLRSMRINLVISWSRKGLVGTPSYSGQKQQHQPTPETHISIPTLLLFVTKFVTFEHTSFTRDQEDSTSPSWVPGLRRYDGCGFDAVGVARLIRRLTTKESLPRDTLALWLTLGVTRSQVLGLQCRTTLACVEHRAFPCLSPKPPTFSYVLNRQPVSNRVEKSTHGLSRRTVCV